MSEKVKALVIVGPTASGKSDLAVRLAKQFNGEIISADSRQVYKGLETGTGKITKREMRGVPHHLLDVVKLSNDRRRQFSVADYQKLAQEKIVEIAARGKLPIICGGTGFYIQAALGELAIPTIPPDLELRKRLEKLSTEKLFKKLQSLNPRRAATIDRDNPRRLVRAIEIATAPGTVPQLINTGRPLMLDFDPLFIGLNLPAAVLRKKIHGRLFQRMKRGLLAEVKNLHDQQKISWRRLEELGLEYRYVSRYLRKHERDFRVASEPVSKRVKREKILFMLKSLETAIWHYAKRQITWFKRDPRIHWLRHSLSVSEPITKLMPKIKEWKSQPKRDNIDTRR